MTPSQQITIHNGDALELGRTAILIELNPVYVEQSYRRLERMQQTHNRSQGAANNRQARNQAPNDPLLEAVT